MEEYLIGVYKEIGKKPTLLKVINTRKELEKLIGGEFSIYNHKDFAVLYKKDTKNLLGNVYFEEYSKIGNSIRGTIFAIIYDNTSQFKSFNKEQALNCINLLIQQSINYNNFHDNRKYTSKNKNSLAFKYEAKRNYNNSSIRNNYNNRQYMTNNHIIKLSDNELLNMIYKISLILVNTITKLSNENKE